MENANCKLKETDTPKFTRGEFNLIESKPNGTIWIEYDAVPRPNIHTIIGAVYPAPYMQGREPISFEEARANAQLWANAHKLYDKAKALFDACALADAVGDLSCYIDGELMNEVAAALAACRVPTAEAQPEVALSKS